MILLKRSSALLVLVLILISHRITAQNADLFQENNLAAFAEYLYRSNQFEYAAEEYQRLLFKAPGNAGYQTRLLESYRKSGNYLKGIQAYENFLKNTAELAPAPVIEYSKINLLSNNFANNTALLTRTSLDPSLRTNLDYTMRLLSLPNYDGSLDGLDQTLLDKGMMQLHNEYESIHFKSRFLAASFSAIIPGSGKVYAGRWKDGIISLLFVGATAYQAYRAFDQKGTESVYGWIVGSFSVGFYLSNIYGSAKAARLYNEDKHNSYREKVTDHYINSF